MPAVAVAARRERIAALQHSGRFADASRVSPISSSAGVSQAYEVAMLGKVKEQAELQGRATLELLDSATATAPPPEGTGTLVDDVA